MMLPDDDFFSLERSGKSNDIRLMCLPEDNEYYQLGAPFPVD